MPGEPVSVLISGDCHGKLGALYKRVAAVNKSAGPFKALFCVGSFFPPSDAAGDNVDETGELLQFIADGKKAPVPTYFVGSFGTASKKAMEILKAADCGIHFLGRSGVTEVAGLTVAFLDGMFDEAEYGADVVTDEPGCRFFRELDVAKLKLAADGVGDVDMFLTCQWPAGILAGIPPSGHPKGIAQSSKPKSGSAMLNELADVIRPRYHVAAGENCFYARPPYQNPDRGVGGHVTRFIALAPVGNPDKEKSLHALKLMPMSLMDLDALMAKPADTTAYPFAAAKKQEGLKRPGEELVDSGSWRFQQKGKKQRPVGKPIPGRPGVTKDPACTIFARNLPFASNEPDLELFFGRVGVIVDIKRPADDQGRPVGHCFVQYSSPKEAEAAMQLNQQELMGRSITIEMSTSGTADPKPTGKPVDSCWFCLSNPSCAVWLIASVGQEAYLTVDKAPMHPQHCLLIPIEHFPSTQSLSTGARDELGRYTEAMRKFYRSQGSELVGFERFMRLRKMGGNHCHVNLVPIAKSAAEKAKSVFEQEAAKEGFYFKTHPSLDGVREEVGDEEYFLAYLPDGSTLVSIIERGKRHPMDFGRRVLAQLLGTPEMANPKDCGLSREEEKQLADEFKTAFKEFDISA